MKHMKQWQVLVGLFAQTISLGAATNFAVGDLNGDRDLDLEVANAGSDDVSILLDIAKSCSKTGSFRYITGKVEGGARSPMSR
ncbi:MAG TPA: hypothetical protein VNL74_08855 [Methylococcus sp.]|nr:hypothetical protein [Methylococcus sp.]